MSAKKHCEAVPRGMFGIIERSGRLRSDTIINNIHAPPQGCRPALQYLSPNGDALHRNYGLCHFFHKPEGSLPVAKRFAVSVPTKLIQN